MQWWRRQCGPEQGQAQRHRDRADHHRVEQGHQRPIGAGQSTGQQLVAGVADGGEQHQRESGRIEVRPRPGDQQHAAEADHGGDPGDARHAFAEQRAGRNRHQQRRDEEDRRRLGEWNRAQRRHPGRGADQQQQRAQDLQRQGVASRSARAPRADRTTGRAAGRAAYSAPTPASAPGSAWTGTWRSRRSSRRRAGRSAARRCRASGDGPESSGGCGASKAHDTRAARPQRRPTGLE